EPRQDGAVVVTTRDVDGRPVRAEVALAVADEAGTAIQSDLAEGPRKVFFGRLRGAGVGVTASVQMRRYLDLVEEKGKLIDDRDIERQKKLRGKEKEEVDFDSMEEMKGGVVGGVVGGMMPSPAPPPPIQRSMVAEAITVTAEAPLVEVSAPMEVHVR